MAKRRAEDPPRHDSPSKRCFRSLCTVDLRLESVPPPGGVSLSPPPSLLALLGSRCRKRPYYFEDPEQTQEDAVGLYRRTSQGESRKHAADVLTVKTCGGFHESYSSSQHTNHKKTRREDSRSSETVVPKAAADAADTETNTEDCAYNSFQYWRAPLPELDLSLLEDVSSHSHAGQRSKVRDTSSDAMEA